MDVQSLDYFFPFFVFSYGFLVIFVAENKALDRLSREKFPGQSATLRGHLPLAYVSLYAGGLWSLQNLLFS